MRFFSPKPVRRRRPEFLSSKYLLSCATGLSVLFVAVHLAGLREFTSVLNGTTGSTEMNWESAAILGAVYVGFYLGFVLVVPVLLLAAAILEAGRKLGTRAALDPAAARSPAMAGVEGRDNFGGGQETKFL